MRTAAELGSAGTRRTVPREDGRELEVFASGARPHLLPDGGHFSIITRRLGDVVDDLLGLARVDRSTAP